MGELEIKQLVDVFELTPDILFWIKDRDSRLVYANNAYLEHSGFHQKSQVYGKTDKELFAPHLALQYITDDRKLLQGELITSRLEMNISKNGELGWFSTSKRPLRNKNAEIIGSYGITRHFQKSSQALANFESIRVPLEFIRNNYHRAISLNELAELSHLSVSALERRFKKQLAKTPARIINEVRLENARIMLVETDAPISEVAYKCGFSDHSYFTKQFKQFFGFHPSKMRDQIKANQSHNNFLKPSAI
ncbi:AraC family transcriptional regulator [Aliiglaciecola lipolytica E3]|uniref:AraC family transcriptional regulator n=2 Tax=Aliiglaciecola TaxID=1406885 RepID=K6YJ03_9ALTE|nr:AraC family transcriptional regulator [Aliiglaciecola lipolytica E3]